MKKSHSINFFHVKLCISIFLQFVFIVACIFSIIGILSNIVLNQEQTEGDHNGVAFKNAIFILRTGHKQNPLVEFSKIQRVYGKMY